MATVAQSQHLQFDEGLQPICPSSQCLNSHLSLSIICIAESEFPIDVAKVMVPLRTDLLKVNPGFSSIIIRNNGKQWWKKVDVKVEDHVVIPTFPRDVSPAGYTQCYDEYLSKIALDKLPETKPLWELHIIKYPTQTAAGTFLFKMHHALGDGFSIMGAVFSLLKRADNTSLPLTFPSSSKKTANENIYRSGLSFVSGCFNTLYDIVSSTMHTAWFGDGRSAVRSGTNLVECLPMHTSRISFSLDDIGKVKSKMGVTVNDIITGMIFYGVQLYAKVKDPNAIKSHKTGLVVLNTRMLTGYQSLDEMLRNKTWGNQFSFIHIPVPPVSDGETVDLKNMILQARNIIKRKKNTLDVYLNGILLSIMGRLRGFDEVSKYVHSVLKNTSFTITNVVGPMEKIAIADHPISSINFLVAGVPQSLIFPVISYQGNITIGISMEKGFIDSQLLISCISEGFKKLLNETI